MPAPRRKLAVVAREAGVSVSTVSKVLRAYPDVAPDTRARVRDVLRRAGYPPEAVATGKRRRRSPLVDVVVASGGSGWTGELLAGLAEEAREPGLGVVLTTVSPGQPVPRHWLDQLFFRGTRGVIGLDVDFTEAQLGYLAAHDIPCVLLDRSELPAPAVAGATRQALAVEAQATVSRAFAAIVAPTARARSGVGG